MSLDIQHIANLARLELTSQEKQKFTGQLSDILAYFEKLKELDTKSIPIASPSMDLVNINRTDQIKNCDQATQEKILDNAPATSGDYFKTHKIL